MSDFTTNLISHWRLDEFSGTRVDAHGPNDLTEASVTVGHQEGLFGSAAEWDGVTDGSELHISNASQVGLEPLGTRIAASFWVTPYQFTNFNALVSKVLWNSSGWRSYWNSAGKVLVAAGGNPGIATSTNSLILNQPNHIFIQYNGTSVKLVVNGVLSSATTTSNLIASTGAFAVGTLVTASPAKGTIENLSIWTNRVFFNSEMFELYNDGDGLIYEEYSDSDGLYPHPVRLEHGIYTRGASSVRKIKK